MPNQPIFPKASEDIGNLCQSAVKIRVIRVLLKSAKIYEICGKPEEIEIEIEIDPSSRKPFQKKEKRKEKK